MKQKQVKTYRHTGGRRVINLVYGAMTKLGVGASHRHLLTVRGRSSGRPRTNPVDVMTCADAQWLVAPYGEVNWVKNLRAAGDGELRRGHARQRLVAREVHPRFAAPVIRHYIEQVPITSAYWSVGADATDDELVVEAQKHPVFRLSLGERV